MNTVLCYPEKDGCYLLLHRTKKKNDLNGGKWIGVGGHFEAGESPEECLVREVSEETGITLTQWNYRGIVTFDCDHAPTEYMHLFTAPVTQDPTVICNEGDLAWVKKEDIPSLPQWEGDRIFLKLLEEDIPFFSLKLVYRTIQQEDRLVEVRLNGAPYPFETGF